MLVASFRGFCRTEFPLGWQGGVPAARLAPQRVHRTTEWRISDVKLNFIPKMSALKTATFSFT